MTLLVLFPFVFGYAGVLLLEVRDRRKQAQARREAQGLELALSRSRGLAGRATSAD